MWTVFTRLQRSMNGSCIKHEYHRHGKASAERGADGRASPCGEEDVRTRVIEKLSGQKIREERYAAYKMSSYARRSLQLKRRTFILHMTKQTRLPILSKRSAGIRMTGNGHRSVWSDPHRSGYRIRLFLGAVRLVAEEAGYEVVIVNNNPVQQHHPLRYG